MCWRTAVVWQNGSKTVACQKASYIQIESSVTVLVSTDEAAAMHVNHHCQRRSLWQVKIQSLPLIGAVHQVGLFFHRRHVQMLPINLLGGGQDVEIESGAE